MKDRFGVTLTTQEERELAETKAKAEAIKDQIPVVKSHHHTELKRRTSKPTASPKSMPLTDLTYRHIARMFAQALPIEGADFQAKIEDYLAVIKALPKEAKVALRVAYIFGSKVPKEEREDLFQDIALAVLKAKVKDERLAYAIARCDWRDWWGKYSIRQHYSLESVTEDDEGNPVTLRELIVGEVEFERKINGKLDAERIWNKLPDHIKPLVNRRLLGYALTPRDGMTLNRWVKAHGYKLLLQS